MKMTPRRQNLYITKVLLKRYSYSQKNHLCWNFFLNKVKNIKAVYMIVKHKTNYLYSIDNYTVIN